MFFFIVVAHMGGRKPKDLGLIEQSDHHAAPLPCFRAPSLQSIALSLGSGSLRAAGLIIANLIAIADGVCKI